MTRLARLLSLLFFVGPLAALPAKSGGDPKDAQRAERLKAMRERARAIKAFRVTGEYRVPVEMIHEPLLRFNDPARNFHDATLWAWGRTGRPVAVLSMEQYPAGNGVTWGYELISLSSGLVTAARTDGWKWSPQKPGLDLQAFADAPAAADSEGGRLRQMKELVRRFTAFEILGPDHQRFELRLLAQPIHRYADPDAGIVDGAIFVIAYGTNPEILVVIEMEREASSAAAWRYGLARVSSAELFVKLKDREVWRQPELVSSSPNDPYCIFGPPLNDK